MTVQQAMNKPMIPPSKYSQLREEVLGMDGLRDCLVNFLVDNGGGNIQGDNSLFSHMQQKIPWLKKPWDVPHEMTTMT